MQNNSLTFNYLGHLGRLGNQMFQYASLLGVANHRGYDYTLPPNNMKHILLYDCFNLDNYESKIANWSSFERLSPKIHSFDQNFFDNCPPNKDILGFFQTEKYFKHIEDKIRNQFQFKQSILLESKKKFDSLYKNNNVISLHIRLTDNLDHFIMKKIGFDFYEKSLSCFNDDIPVLIFSDDIETCMRQKNFSGSRFSFSNNSNQFIDMCMMTMCNYHIISNSTFAWWGAWLSNSQKVIAPREWYNSYIHNVDEWYQKSYLTSWNPYESGTLWDSTDICPNGWILI